ncbi:odorant binding protein [Trichonephila clavata]|uniref:Odorant binding protein n=1 Tax=Trichonephila clavata TaxID=2740835 RepID=A0A8X6IK41_TRICU|nr:odorant binding protein [Trichonephila clavata]
MTLPHYSFSQIDWGKCPQLKPTEADKEQKRVVIQKCLDENPPPALETVTDPKQIDDHREIVTTCALKTEGWFNSNGTYNLTGHSLKSSLRNRHSVEKRFLCNSTELYVEKSITQRHQECQDEAVKRFPDGFIQQVQLYQACMDYHIAEICEIELIPPPGENKPPQGPQSTAQHKQSQKKPPKKDVSMFF